ncbi:MAG: hypothetical protein EPO21_23555 [Chloroflexota bacterium]|nr:MAG: hypothetical protein EPO21_23555 [Chloroflexota bacterium]
MVKLSLRVRPFGSYGIEFGPSVPFLPIDESKKWNAVVLKCLILAFQDRATCLIESLVEGDTDKHAFVLDFGHFMARTLRQKGVLVGCVPSVTPELAAVIVESMEFELGWLWLSVPSSMEDSYIHALVSAIYASQWRYEQLDTTEELLLEEDDGWSVVWLNPRLSRDVIIQELGKLAQSVGWDLDVETAC